MPGPKDVLLWKRFRTWLSLSKKFCSPEAAKEFGLDILGDEISILEKELSQGYQEIGFCHNDLQYGNIMMAHISQHFSIYISSTSIFQLCIVIRSYLFPFFFQDYEYASYNPIAYDLANHFCEMAANYHSETPHILDFSICPGEYLI
ncbi:hypothetical protein Goari_009619 [Gossypium aridum]|uniref:Uncharacterized protein n=1 Tax=Gossypium aridum TaxID=34290 RepID=A0A7J8XXK8_GOSAI|nr:hypothetical protein [Gossypium aridum]